MATSVTNFWWRDDDAGVFYPNLTKILQLSERASIPIALAVVPAWLDPKATDTIGTSKNAMVLQHGWAHRSHAFPGQKKIELGGSATPDANRPLLAIGSQLLKDAFGVQYLSVLVPPWNRIDAHHRELIKCQGYAALSTFASSAKHSNMYPIPTIDTHIDAIDWRHGARFKSFFELQSAADHHIASGAPTVGLLTHHLEHDEVAFGVLERFATYVARHSRARWVGIDDLLERGVGR